MIDTNAIDTIFIAFEEIIYQLTGGNYMSNNYPEFQSIAFMILMPLSCFILPYLFYKLWKFLLSGWWK